MYSSVRNVVLAGIWFWTKEKHAGVALNILAAKAALILALLLSSAPREDLGNTYILTCCTDATGAHC